NPATRGVGVVRFAEGKPEVSGTDPEQMIDLPAAYIKLISTEGADLGTWLVSANLDEQRIDIDGKPYEIALRFRREYLPYTMHLTKFTHDVYEGTEKPKDYRSHIRLSDSETNTQRDVEIYMNAPLRYRGKTFYQSSFMDGRDPGTSRGTVLQVVDNPGWLIPYISCALVALGMLVHFGIGLVQFLIRTVAPKGAVA